MNIYFKRVVWILLFLCGQLFAEDTPTVVPVNEEPRHHQVLENDYVRMFDVTVAPQDATLMHRHDRDYMFITLGDASISNERMNEKPIAVNLKDGDARYVKGGFAHVARDTGNTPFHNLTIELKNPGAPGCGLETKPACETPGSSGMTQELFSTERVTVRVLTLNAGQETPAHTHAHPHMAVALDDLTFENHVESKPVQNLSMKKGEWKWLSESDIAHSLKNIGTQTARMLLLEVSE